MVVFVEGEEEFGSDSLERLLEEVRDGHDEPPLVPSRPPLPAGAPNYVTPRGLAALREERRRLLDGVVPTQDSADDRARAASLDASSIVTDYDRAFFAAGGPVDDSASLLERLRELRRKDEEGEVESTAARTLSDTPLSAVARSAT